MKRMDKQGLREKINEAVDLEFRAQLKTAVCRKFGIVIETMFNIFSLRLESRRADGADFTEEQLAYIQAFEEGYIAAWDIVSAKLIDEERKG